MTLREEQKKVQKAMNTTLSGLREDPFLAQRVLAHQKGEEPVAKKISFTMILAIALVVLSMTAALAAGLGVFGTLSQSPDADGRLPVLENNSESVHASVTTEDGITVEVGQAYYEGDRVFISYRMFGDYAHAELYEGAPEEEYAWNDVLENFVCAENLINDVPELQKLISWLDGKGQRWGKTYQAMLHDGLYLMDGTYLNIIGGAEYIQEDGTILGWKECLIPEDKTGDELQFKAVLFRIHEISFQDGSTLKRYVESGESTDIPFTLHRNDSYRFLKGNFQTEAYSAQAELALGRIDLKGTVRLSCPEAWIQVWETWEGEEQLDMIADWLLYRGETLVSDQGAEGIHVDENGQLCFDLLYPADDIALEELYLVPRYSQSGEHRAERIPIVPIDTNLKD